MSTPEGLRHTEERLRRLFRSSPAAIGLVRFGDGILLDVNEAYERLFGWPRQEVIGRSVDALGIWADPADRMRFRAMVAAQGRLSGFESKARRKDGSIFDSVVASEIIDEGGESIILVIVLDVSGQKRVEAALRESEQRNRALVELSSDWYWATDREHRFYLREGDVLHRMGLPPQGDYGKQRWEMGFLNMTKHDWDEHRGVLERREEFRDLLLERASEDGRTYWATISGRPLFDGEGEFIGYHGTGRDITLQIFAERELRRLNEELEQKVAARTAELDAANRELEAFSYSVSHDLRAPLLAIDGFSSLLEQHLGPLLDEEARRLLQRVRGSVADMGRLIEDMLALARAAQAAPVKRLVDLGKIAEAELDILRAGSPARQVQWRVAAHLRARADPGLMHVVLKNLLGNAWKYTGGKSDARIEFYGNDAGEFIVADNGAGFDPAHAHNLFQPFQRLHTDAEFEGNGVGLATVKRIIERHGGSVRGEGAPGQGARFYFTLPVE